MSIKIINFDKKNTELERSVNPSRIRKLPINRPKQNLETILNNISPKETNEEKKDDKKVLFNDVVEIAQYEKPSELKSTQISLIKKPTVVDILNNRTPSPKRKQKEITEFFKKEIETLDSKLGKRTRSPSPIRCSSPVKNYYKSNYDTKKSPVKSTNSKMRKVRIKLDKNWFKERPFLIYNEKTKKKVENKLKISKLPKEEAVIIYSVLGF